MSATTETTTAPMTGTGGARSRLPRVRPGVAMTVAVVLALLVAVLATRGSEQYPGVADPRNPGPDGAQAVARVLEDNGVEVTIARSAAELADTKVGRRTTVVVSEPDRLAPSTLRQLRAHVARAGRVVLVEPSYSLVRQLDDDVATLGATGEDTDAIEAGCAAAVTGTDLGGLELEVDSATGYASEPEGEGCFPTGAGALLLPVDGWLLLGAAQALSNDQVTRGDNAAIALRLLGHDPRVVWYVPDPADAVADDAVSIGSLLPDWIGPGLWLGALALLALVLWRLRRLGPLSTEPLPVVVRAVETASSRGRMYRRSGDRGHAAAALRRAARADIAERLRLERTATPAAVAEAAARHLGSAAAWPAGRITALLTDDSPSPATEADLVRLAQELAQLRREVRRS